MTFTIDSAPDCARAWEAMPWVLQDSAPAAQKDWLMTHLAQCEACSAEFAQQTRLRVAMSLPSDVPLDVDSGMARLLTRLETLDADAIAPPARRANWVFKALAAAVLIQALGIGVLGTRLLSDRSSAPYRTLSTPAPAAVAGAIRVVPDPDMKLADWNKLLHSLDLKIISGPNAVGAYTVAPAGSTGSAQSLQQLRASAGIRLAEPVDNTP